MKVKQFCRGEGRWLCEVCKFLHLQSVIEGSLLYLEERFVKSECQNLKSAICIHYEFIAAVTTNEQIFSEILAFSLFVTALSDVTGSGWSTVTDCFKTMGLPAERKDLFYKK